MCVFFFFFFQFVERCAHKDLSLLLLYTHTAAAGGIGWNGRTDARIFAPCGFAPPPTLAGHRPSAAQPPLPLRDRASTILKPEFCGPSVIVPRNDCIDHFAL